MKEGVGFAGEEEEEGRERNCSLFLFFFSVIKQFFFSIIKHSPGGRI